MEMIPYADWPESQYMMSCRHSWDVGETSARVCLKNGECTCLTTGETLPEDREDGEDGEE